MKLGARVMVTEGPDAGSVGVLEAIWIEGLAVRLPTGYPFGRVAIFEHSQLKRLCGPKRKHRSPDSFEALV